MTETQTLFSLKSHNGCVTMVNPKTGNHRTIRVETQPKDAKFAPGSRIVSLLTGSNNETDYTGFGFVTESGTVAVWRKKQDSVFVRLADMIGRPESNVKLSLTRSRARKRQDQDQFEQVKSHGTLCHHQPEAGE
jgi:hypothetical protein